MHSTRARNACGQALAISSLSLLSACGGGSGHPPDAVAADPPPASPAPPQQPAPPPPPPAPPPVQPGPPPEVMLAGTYTELVAGTINSQPGWPAWVAPPNRAAVGGVGCLASEEYHLHALVTIYKDGVRLGLPGNLGRGTCNYELHTHDATGIVHIETDVARTFTLGQFFALWGQPLGTGAAAGLAGPVRFYVIQNEKLAPAAGDPAQLELGAHREIVIISGTAPPVLPKYRWPGTI